MFVHGGWRCRELHHQTCVCLHAPRSWSAPRLWSPWGFRRDRVDFLVKINQFLNKVLTLTGGAVLIGMILLTCANIFIRQFYIPIRGTFELMGYAGALVTAFALGYTQLTRGHICVDVLVNTYPKPLKRLIYMINHGVCAGFFFIVAWQMIKKAMILKNAGDLSETLRIIYYPFTLAVAFGCFILALTLFPNFLLILFPQKAGAK